MGPFIHANTVLSLCTFLLQVSSHPPVRAARESLLEAPRILRWYKDHRARSTAMVQLAQLELFLRRVGLNAEELIRLAKLQATGGERRFEDIILSWIEAERKAGRPDSYISTNWAAVKSFLKHEEAAPSWTPKLRVRGATTIMSEVVPSPEQLREVLDRNPVHRIRALILLLATSGIRPGVLGTRFDPPNGLRLRAFPELRLETGKAPRFERTPIRIDVPADLSKGGQAYFTFASEEAAQELLAYLGERLARGEELRAESATFAPEPKASHIHLRRAADGIAFLNEKGIADEVRRALRKTQPLGVRWRPYVLRGFASTQMMLGENAQLMSRDSREFVLGHVANVGRRYNLGKGRIRTDIEEAVREQYARVADRYLRILTISQRAVDYRPVLRVLLASSGYSKSEIDAMGELTEESCVAAIRAKREAIEVPAPRPGDNARTVSVRELDRWLERGWRPIGPAGSERFIVDAPN